MWYRSVMMFVLFSWVFVCGSLTAETKVFRGCFDQPIPAVGNGEAWMDPVWLDVSEHFIIADLNVCVDIHHSNVTELQIILDSPWGESIILKNDWEIDWRDEKADMLQTVFDDEAEDSLISGNAPFSGNFLPCCGYSLSVFDAHDAYGMWGLRIYDAVFADSGELDFWQLEFADHQPEPLSSMYFFFSVILLRLRVCKIIA